MREVPFFQIPGMRRFAVLFVLGIASVAAADALLHPPHWVVWGLCMTLLIVGHYTERHLRGLCERRLWEQEQAEEASFQTAFRRKHGRNPSSLNKRPPKQPAVICPEKYARLRKK